MSRLQRTSNEPLLVLFCIFLFCQSLVAEFHPSNCCGRMSDSVDCTQSTLKYVPKPSTSETGWCKGIGNFSNAYIVIELKLSESRITELQKEVFINYPNVKTISCDNNNISFLKADAFHFPGQNSPLENLSLRYDRINEIDKNAFAGLSNLTSLYLSWNHIRNFSSNVFDPLSKVTELWLNGNRIVIVDKNLFQNMLSLKQLSLSSNLIEILEQFPESLKSLEELHVENNSISELHPDTLRNLLKLGRIDLSSNKLMTIDENTFECNSKIYSINLSNNKLESLPQKTFYNLCGLRTLDISNNKLTFPHFEWFANIVYQSKYFGIAKKNLKPVTSDNAWNCDCSMDRYLTFMFDLCSDTKLNNKGLFDYFNIECTDTSNRTGKNLVPNDCEHKCPGNALNEIIKSKKTSSSSCSKDNPICKYLSDTCPVSTRSATCYKQPIAKSSEQQIDPPIGIVAFGGFLVIIIISAFACFMKRSSNRKQHVSDNNSVSTQPRPDSTTDYESYYSRSRQSWADLSERPRPIGASEPSLLNQSIPTSVNEDVCLDDVTDDDDDDSSYRKNHPNALTIPKIVFSNTPETTIPKEINSGNAVQFHQQPVKKNNQYEMPSHINVQSLEDDSTMDTSLYTPMRPLIPMPLVLSPRINPQQTVSANLTRTSSHLSSHKYESMPNTCSEGYEIPIRRIAPPDPPARINANTRNKEKSSNRRPRSDQMFLLSEPRDKTKKSEKLFFKNRKKYKTKK